MNGESRRKAILVFAVLSGLLTGTAIPELFCMGTGTYAGLFSLYSLEKYEGTRIAAGRLLPYIIGVRLPALLFLWMSCYTTAGLFFHAGYAWWLAASAGILLSLFVLQDGYNGFVLFLCCLMPQWLIYVSMWKKELAFLFFKQCGRENAALCSAAAIRRRELEQLGGLAALCLFGCAAEAFLGTWTLKIFLQYFT